MATPRLPFEFSNRRVQDITQADAARMLKVLGWAAATTDSDCGECARDAGVSVDRPGKDGCACCLARKIANALEQRRRMRVWRSRSQAGRAMRARRAA
jgi:hypothetical protein